MNVAALPYRQLQAELKALKARGYTVPKLNSKRAILETALTELIGQQPATAAWIKLPKKTLISIAQSYGIKVLSRHTKADLAQAIVLH